MIGVRWVVAAWALAAVAPAEAQSHVPSVSVETRFEPYTLHEGSLAEVVDRLNGMRLEGPTAPPSQGLTRYDIRPEWSLGASGGRCRVTRVSVRVQVVIVLPEWPSVATRPVDERRAWSTIEAAIREHETVHRDLVVAAAEDLAADLRGREATGCRALRQVVAGALSIAEGELREAHAEHDRTSPTRLPIG